MRSDLHALDFCQSISRWDEALPLGNGRMGCLIYGDGSPLRFTLDRTDLWDNRPAPETLEEGFTYANMVRLVTSGRAEDFREHVRLFDDIYNRVTPTKLAAGRLEFDCGFGSDRLRSRLDITRAVAFVQGEGLTVEAFCSAVRNLGAARFRGAKPALRLHVPSYLSGMQKQVKQLGDGGQLPSCQGLGYPPARFFGEDGFTWFVQQAADGLEFSVLALTVPCEGGEEIYFTVAASPDGADWLERAKNTLREAAHAGYERLREEHAAWWERYWAQSEVQIPSPEIERVYYRSNYLLASCSREGCYPMPLQGVWTADDEMLPPWKGDYHHDLNTQMSYQSYMKANHMPEGKAFVDYLWNLRPAFARFAAEFYGVDGLMIPGTSTLDGRPLGGWPQYALSPAATMWAAQSFDHYYRYSGDESFLKERAWPFYRDVAKAVTGLLQERGGKYVLPLSSSPEVYDNTPQSYQKPNTNNDLALLIFTFRTAAEYARLAGADSAPYERVLGKLDDIAISPAGVIRMNAEADLPQSHRHLGHLMCVYPLHLIPFDTQEHRRVILASIDQLLKYGYGWWVGFSFDWMAQICGKALLGNTCGTMLEIVAKALISPNGFHLNGDYQRLGYTQFHYRPFTLESNFGLCDALQEMLLQCSDGYLHLFPAIPDAWREQGASFRTLRCYGGVLVTASIRQGRIVRATLTCERPCRQRVLHNFASERLILLRDGVQTPIPCRKGEVFELALSAGENVILAE